MAKYSKNIEDIKSAVKENQLVCDKNNAYYIKYNRDLDKFYIICRSNNYTIGLSHIDKKTKKEKINMGEPKGYWFIHTIDELLLELITVQKKKWNIKVGTINQFKFF